MIYPICLIPATCSYKLINFSPILGAEVRDTETEKVKEGKEYDGVVLSSSFGYKSVE